MTPGTPLPPRALHRPYEPGPHRLQLGLLAIQPGDLIELDDRYPGEMRQRRDLLAHRHADVFAARPGSEAARRETLDYLAALLPARYPAHFARDGATLNNHLTGERWDLGHPPCDPLELAGRLVQEDLCLLDIAGDAPVLAAAILCFPSRWTLAEKIGRPLIDVHAPVPGYAETLSRPVDRFMRHLRATPTCRLNWSVVDDPALFQQGGKHRTQPDPTITPGRLNLRVERQTLSLLPASRHVLFTIRVHTTPLADAIDTPAEAARLAAAVRALPDAMAAYKSVPAFRTTLLAWLDARAA